MAIIRAVPGRHLMTLLAIILISCDLSPLPSPHSPRLTGSPGYSPELNREEGQGKAWGKRNIKVGSNSPVTPLPNGRVGESYLTVMTPASRAFGLRGSIHVITSHTLPRSSSSRQVIRNTYTNSSQNALEWNSHCDEYTKNHTPREPSTDLPEPGSSLSCSSLYVLFYDTGQPYQQTGGK